MNGVQRPSYDPSLHSNHSKLSDVTAGKLSVKSQFITLNSNKAMGLWPLNGANHPFVAFTGSATKRILIIL